MNSEEYKKQVYKRWKEQGERWFSKDPSKDPTWEEKQIIIEMKKQENIRDLERGRPRPKPKNEIKAFHRLMNEEY